MSLYLTRLILNIRNRAVQQDIANCQAMHRRVMAAFSDDIATSSPRMEIDLLYRLETALDNKVTLHIQSKQQPNWSTLPQGYIVANCDMSQEDHGILPLSVREITGVLTRLTMHRHYRFQILACPCKKIGTSTKEEQLKGIKNNGKRIPLKTIEEQVAWMNKKGDENGFKVVMIDIEQRPAIYGKKKSQGEEYMKHQGVYYKGILQITNVEQFKECLQKGIGPAKSYGFGLLMIAAVE